MQPTRQWAQRGVQSWRRHFPKRVWSHTQCDEFHAAASRHRLRHQHSPARGRRPPTAPPQPLTHMRWRDHHRVPARHQQNASPFSSSAPTPPIVLGIETSCDDTGVGVVTASASTISGDVLAQQVSSQFEVHAPHRGVVPALAAREHRNNLPLVLDRVMQAIPGGGNAVTHVAATAGPGLALCLQVGFETARELARNLDVPFIGVNHLEAHALVPRLLDPSLTFPFLILLVSGGHTMIVLAKGIGDYQRLGSTLDDSLGEAFDKAARIVRVGAHVGAAAAGAGAATSDDDSSGNYAAATSGDNGSGSGSSSRGGDDASSADAGAATTTPAAEPDPEVIVGHGGAALEQLASLGDPTTVKLPVPMSRVHDCNFSYSGLKTSVMHAARRVDLTNRQDAANVAASFQRVATQHLTDRVARALRWCRLQSHITGNPAPSTLVVCGGVAANAYIRAQLEALGAESGVRVAMPPLRYCTDNGVMIAWAALERLRAGFPADDIDESDFSARWPLGDPRPAPGRPMPRVRK